MKFSPEIKEFNQAVLSNGKKEIKIPDFPFDINLQITNACNSNCIHCCASSVADGKHISLELVKRIAAESKENRAFYFVLSGGEPLVHPNFFEIVELLQKDFALIINTNATLIDKPMAKKLAEHSIDDFHVSLDAPNQKIYSMQRGNNTRIDSVINGIKNLREQGLRVTIKVVITKINQHCLEELVELGKSLGAERVNFAVFKPVGRGMENLLRLELSKKETKECVDRIYELKENNPQIFVSYDNAQAFCHPKSSPGVYKKICGGYYIRINEDGNITPCPFIDKSAGNILKTSIAKAWKHRVFEDLRKFSLATSLNGKCEKCKEREVCTGGCRARPLAKNLSIRSYDPLCWR